MKIWPIVSPNTWALIVQCNSSLSFSRSPVCGLQVLHSRSFSATPLRWLSTVQKCKYTVLPSCPCMHWSSLCTSKGEFGLRSVQCQPAFLMAWPWKHVHRISACTGVPFLPTLWSIITELCSHERPSRGCSCHVRCHPASLSGIWKDWK